MRRCTGTLARWRSRPAVRRYCDPVALLGAVVLVALVPASVDAVRSAPRGLALMAALVLVTELPTALPGLRASRFALGTGMTFGYATLLCYGLGPAAVLIAAETVVVDLSQRKQPWRAAFNSGMHVLCMAAARLVLDAGGVPALADGDGRWHPLTAGMLPIVLAGGFAYVAGNHVLVSVAFARRDGVRPIAAVRGHLDLALLGDAALLSLSPAIVVCLQADPVFVPLFLLPLLAVYRSAAVTVERERESMEDALTGLPNRTALLQRLESALDDRARDGHPVALFLVDLDRFKEVNDTLGHSAGDRLLGVVAERLAGVLRPGDVVARLGGDEFGVLLPAVRDADAAAEVALRVHEALAQPEPLEGFAVTPEASIGVALVPDHALDARALMQRADVALYLAKSSRRGVEVYSPDRDRNSAARLNVVGEVRASLQRGELELHYQPQARLADGEVCGVEALLRWRHPVRGVVGPDDFLPVAEQSGLMPELTRWVVDTAVAQAAAWRADGLELEVAVNVSARDLHDLRFVDQVRTALEAHGLPGSWLTVEVTEDSLMADADGVAVVLEELSGLGVGVSLDDFGTGYSSLVHLRRLPVREVKVDRSFVMAMHRDHDDATIVRSIIELAGALGLRVVAEGVETPGAWQQLAALGCDVAQGWHLARAMPAAQATAWLLERRGQRPPLRLVDGARVRRR